MNALHLQIIKIALDYFMSVLRKLLMPKLSMKQKKQALFR